MRVRQPAESVSVRCVLLKLAWAPILRYYDNRTHKLLALLTWPGPPIVPARPKGRITQQETSVITGRWRFCSFFHMSRSVGIPSWISG